MQNSTLIEGRQLEPAALQWSQILVITSDQILAEGRYNQVKVRRMI